MRVITELVDGCPHLVELEVADHDAWNVDITLAPIIHALLIKLKQNKHGAPEVDQADVPVHLRYEHIIGDDPHDDPHYFARWDWVLDEMIWAFAQIMDDNNDEQFYTDDGMDSIAYKAHTSRIQRGTVLFGKYYRGLWD